MVCLYPIQGFRARDGKIVFNRNMSVSSRRVDISCGRCMGCRIQNSRQWALRCMHESKCWSLNSFVTLTYSNKHLPEHNSLDLDALQLFMKRLRKSAEPRTVRFFACGEYGDKYDRPHYHVLLFNWDFLDKKFEKYSKGSNEPLFSSKALSDLWPFGECWIGAVTFKSAAYCARYVMKKASGEGLLRYAPHVDPTTGEVFGPRRPPFAVMSRRPGIGAMWIEKFMSDAFPSDYLILDGAKVPVPRFYSDRYKKIDPASLERIKLLRAKKSRETAHDRTPDRLKVRGVILASKLKRLSRETE